MQGRKTKDQGIISEPITQTPMELDRSFTAGIRWVPKHTYPLRRFEGVKQFKSVWRAMRRMSVSRAGIVLPSRPFNNSSRTKGRKLQIQFEKTLENLKNAKHKRKDS